METFTVEGKVREERGKNAARRTRQTGMVPAVLYGGRKDSMALVGEREAGGEDPALGNGT